MRVHRWWKVGKWLPLFFAMNNMLKELQNTPRDETGFLGHWVPGSGAVVQYWRSFEHLERYASSDKYAHRPAWTAFYARMKGAAGDVGLWHETYLVRAGDYETLYVDMPPHGLASASSDRPVTGRNDRASQRLGGGTA